MTAFVLDQHGIGALYNGIFYVAVYGSIAVAWIAYQVALGRTGREAVGEERRAKAAGRAELARKGTAVADEDAAAKAALRLAASQEYENAASTPGTPEWNRRRYRIRAAQVRAETGIVWRKDLYVSARTPAERRARELMNELRAVDGRGLRTAHVAKQDAKIAKGRINSPRAAELAMAKWMEIQCLRGVTVCSPGADGGIDIRAEGAVAQVKYWKTKPIGRPVLQQLRGATEDANCLVFALEGAGYTRQALAFAEDTGMALFEYDSNGNVEAVTSRGEFIIAAGWAQRNS